jgi:mannose-6-phosphate isomerase-like protein (cupin superfamily)
VSTARLPAAPEPWISDVRGSTTDGREHAYEEILRVPALSVGLFAAATGHEDTQQPHARDEVYVVLSGTALLEIAGKRRAVTAGTVAYLPAGVPHRFLDIRGDLRVVVVFAPPAP